MSKTSMKHKFSAHIAFLLATSLCGLSACKQSESQQSNFRREKGMLWWKEVETLLSLPAEVTAQELKDFDFAAFNAEGAPGRIPSFMKSCWYNSTGKDDVKSGKDFINRVAVTQANAYSQKPVVLGDLVAQMQSNPKLQPVLLEWTAAATKEVQKQEKRQGKKMNGVVVGALTGMAIGVFACSALSVGLLAGPCIAVGGAALAPLAPLAGAGAVGSLAVQAVALPLWGLGFAMGWGAVGTTAGAAVASAAATGAGIGGIVSAMTGSKGTNATTAEQPSPFLMGLREQASRVVTVNAEQMRLLVQLTIGNGANPAAQNGNETSAGQACPAPAEYKNFVSK